MKKRFLALALCAALPLMGTGSAFGAAGSAGDPLISLSYISDRFLPETRRGLADTASAVLEARAGETQNWKLLTLSPGQCVVLTQGQQLLLLSGAAAVWTETGALIDASAGAVAENGPARLYARYIAGEDARVFVDAAEESVIRTSYGTLPGTGCPFLDVARGAWYYGDVREAYARGLVSGMTADSYEPAGTLTMAQCVTLAANMRQLWQDGAVTLKMSPPGTLWYRSFADYCLENGILEREAENYDAVIDRAEFVRLFYRALPESAYGRLNDVPDGAIPDVAMDDESAPEIYAFYRAGILAGYAADGTHAERAFDAASTITRAEVAAIMNRMFDETARVRFQLSNR